MSVAAQDGRFARWMRERRQNLGDAWRFFRSPLLVGATGALAGATLLSLVMWRGVVDTNAAIVELNAGRDLQVDLNARSELLIARIAFLTKRDDADRARAFVEALDRREGAEIKSRGHYLLANALLRKALGLAERGEIDAVGPFVTLAKREYRLALQLVPDFWDAKYNFDVAARLVRDFPEIERKDGDELYADPKKLWTDIPGAPKGLP